MRIAKCMWKYYQCKRRSFGEHKSLLSSSEPPPPPPPSLSHHSENLEELLFSSGINTHHIEGTCETGFLLRRFLCAVVILKHIPKCSFRKRVIFFFFKLMKGKLCWSWGLILLNIFINILSHGLRCTLLALTGDTKLVREQGQSLCCRPRLPLGRPWQAGGTW